MMKSSPENLKYRPLIHYSVPKGWMNDPNGLVYHNGFYHLFFQHYPDGLKHGTMHWGHARSKGLTDWEHLPIALYPDELGVIYSGSAIVDYDNVSGLGSKESPSILAFFTHHRQDGKQYQSLAYSNDDCVSFEKYAHNPIIVNEEERNFRDPKVFWHEESGAYIMVIAAGKRILFYRSENLLQWDYSGAYADESVCGSSVFECPDLVQFLCDGATKWVLIFSLIRAQNEGWRMGYVTGNFDGNFFIPDYKKGAMQSIDDGIDNYAAVTFSGIPDGRAILLGWMNCWDYADKIPAETFRGSMTLPREINLVNTQNGYRICQMPAREVTDKFRMHQSFSNFEEGPFSLSLKEIPFMIRLIAAPGDFHINFKNDDDLFSVSFDMEKMAVVCDRSQCGITDFSPEYAKMIESQVEHTDNVIDFLMVFDTTSVEIFACGGKNVMTVQLFNEKRFTNLSITDAELIERLELYYYNN